MKNDIKIGVTVAIQAPPNSPFPIVHRDVYETIDWVSREGFDSIEFHLQSPDIVDGIKLKSYCGEKGLEISTIGTGMATSYEGLTLTNDNEEIREKAIQRLIDQIELASILDCAVIIGSMRGTILDMRNRTIYEERFENGLKRIMKHAELKNVDVVIEAIDRYETNYLLTAKDILNVIKKIDSNNLYVHLDTFHMNMEEVDWATPILQCNDLLGHVHAADNNRNYPGWGHIDFKSIISALKEIGYKKSITIECFPQDDGYLAAKKGLHFLRNLL